MKPQSGRHWRKLSGGCCISKGLKAKAWKLCSEYIRRKHADANGYVKCVSCEKVIHWKESDCAHFYPKGRAGALYFTEENLAPACPGCNRFNVEIHKIGFTKYMLDMYGRDFVDELGRQARQIKRWRKAELEELVEYFKKQIQGLNDADVSGAPP